MSEPKEIDTVKLLFDGNKISVVIQTFDFIHISRESDPLKEFGEQYNSIRDIQAIVEQLADLILDASGMNINIKGWQKKLELGPSVEEFFKREGFDKFFEEYNEYLRDYIMESVSQDLYIVWLEG
ncbi:MAG: hypothetical protein KAS66_08055 [Candidatus Omnitrophica bacterium]|nr:hypothetical protein [Candidatus Omnitrophota bacterium]